MLDLKHLVSLTTIRDSGSPANAAKILNLSLSALSHQMKELETNYNCILFIRKTKPLRFTSAGEKLLEYADKIIPLFNEVDHELSEFRQNKANSFYVSLECHSCYEAILPTLGEFRKLWPEIDVDFTADFKFHPLPKLSSKALDLVITGDPISLQDIEYTPLFHFEMMIGLPSSHDLSRKKFLTPEELKDRTLIAYPIEKERMSIFRGFFSPAGLAPKNVRSEDRTAMIIELISSGKGFCCLPDWVFSEFSDHADIRPIRPGKKGIRETIYVANRSEDRNHPFIRDFIRLAKITSAKNLKGIELCP